MLWHDELTHDNNRVSLFLGRILEPVDQLVAIVRANQHRWDPDSTTCAIVAHQNLINHLGAIVDNNGDSHAQILHVPHLLHETALATASDHERTDVVLSMQLVLLVIHLLAGERVHVWVVKHAHDGLAIGHETKVGVIRSDGRIYK